MSSLTLSTATMETCSYFFPELVKSTGCEMPFLRWLTTTSRFTDLLAQCLERNKTPLRRAHQRRSIILATDIAETSLTVDGVNIVVDSGLVRVPRFDSRTGMTRLMTIASSRSSAEQRSGRAGRTGPGVCYRLWSKVEHTSRLAFLNPRSIRSSSVDSHSNLRNGRRPLCSSPSHQALRSHAASRYGAPYHPGSRH